MKKQILIFVLMLVTTLVFSQTKVDSLVQIGIHYHDNQEYDKAIETYKTALIIEPNSALVNYEIALSFMYAKDYKNALIHSDIVIDLNDKFILEAYITKGSSLDYLDRTQESIELFEKGIKQFGDHYLLYYNLGYNYYNLKEYDKAEQAFINAINTKSNHASSHLLLGYLMLDKGQKVQSLLCFHYFLFLEPNSGRSKTVYNLLQKQFSGNVESDKDDPKKINIYLNPDKNGSEFGAVDVMISMLQASKALEKNKGKSEDQLFLENTISFFKILGELKKEENTGLWWDYYVPLFYDIAKSEHIDTYCNYISQSSNSVAEEWLKANDKKLDAFDTWLQTE